MKTNKAVKKAIQKKLYEMSFYEFFCKAFEVIEPSVPFSANWHHKYLCDILQEEAERITKGEQKTKDIIVNIPFRSTKSLLVTVLYPVWCWVINPKMKFITASYSAELSIEHATKSRDVIFSDWFTNLWGEYVKIKKDQNLKARYENTSMGVRRATSVGGTITGQGGDIIIVDDPLSPQNANSAIEREKANEWYRTTLYSRLNNPHTGVRIIIMQRIHERDLSGFLLQENRANYRHICIPAEDSPLIHPKSLREYYQDGLFWTDRFSRDILDDYKIALGSYGYAGQLMQSPTPADGGYIKAEWFETTYAKKDGVVNFIIDPAYTANQKNDPSALLAYVYKDNEWQITAVENVYMEFPQLVKHIPNFCQKNGYTSASRIFVEPKASGKSIVQTLRRETKLNVQEDKPPSKDKVARVQDVSATMESGRVKILKGKWNSEFLLQCEQFPASAHDDMVDCLVMAINKQLFNDKIVFFG